MRLNRTVLSLLLLGAAAPLAAQAPAAPPRPPFTLTSSAFKDGGTIPVKHTQADPAKSHDGMGVSPQLGWVNPPAGTVTFVLNFHDMEVARNKTLDDQPHWIVWNIPADAKELAEDQPEGAKLPNGAFQISLSGLKYRGPGAPATGVPHHYMFELLALDTKIDVAASDDAFETRKRVLDAVQGHVIGKALILGLFKRPAS